jgi:hypothetical protein
MACKEVNRFASEINRFASEIFQFASEIFSSQAKSVCKAVRGAFLFAAKSPDGRLGRGDSIHIEIGPIGVGPWKR